ncbi:MAG TPA: hypothetical protein VK617_13050, partial [Gemmatimonadaceae bacterium]|nr:hypothetical protein [Gemmatimonadaceae bacterium]
ERAPSAATPSAAAPSPAAPTPAAPESPPPGNTGKRRRVPVFASTLIVGFLLGLGVLFAWRQSRLGTPAGGAKVLAVLPFENLGDSANAYLADGITNELRGKLSELSSIQVIARGSSAPIICSRPRCSGRSDPTARAASASAPSSWM